MYLGSRWRKKITSFSMTQSKEYRSVSITRIFMKMVGLWYVESPREQQLLRVAFGYAIWAIVFAIAVEAVDLYYCINAGDFYAVAFNVCAELLLIMVLVKLGSFMFYRYVVMDLICFAQKKFWNVIYDEVSAQILKEYDKLGMIMVYTFTLIVSVGTFNYIFAPLFEEKMNGTERILPFKLWIDFPYHSPYYEITYTIQSLSTIHAGICTCCFDNFVSTFNIHTAAQLKILAYKVQTVTKDCIDNLRQKYLFKTDKTTLTYKKLQDCVQQHLILIHYVHNMQRAFAAILLGQLLLSSVVICFGGFQFLATNVIIRKILFGSYFVGGLIQLLIYTWTCNDIIVQSTAICDAAYNSKWYLLPNNGPGKAVRKGLIMIMIRARRPCILTAGNFAVVSLETFMGILSTAMSYFTLLRQATEENI